MVSFLLIFQLLKQNKLRITTRSAEILRNIPTKCENTVSLDIQKSIDDLLEFKTKPEPQFIPHPNEMTLEELECHLMELQEKNMETRGVLRKLIQLHSRLGDSTRAEQLRKIFEEAGYEETLGMKSAMMHSYVTGGHLEPALDAYREIKKSDPEFLVDSFKVIDLATLLVKADRSAEALDVMEEASKLKVLGGPTIQRNCLELLKAYKDEHEQKVMFRLLIDEGYCKENNIILGALVRIHMNNGDLEKAASTYISLTEKYKCTPLQLEVIRELVKKENVDSLQSVLNATKAVHGYNSTQAVLIAALAENGQEKALMKVIATQKPNVKKALMARCERWVKEGKLAPLKILAKCCERLSNDTFDMNIIFRCIMKIHSINNDCESALKFYEHLMERELPIPREIEDLLYKLLKYNNYKFPKFLNRC